MLGFDAEWKVTYQRGEPQAPVALIQICTDIGVYLFHIHQYGFPDELIRIMNHSKIIKIGLNISGDILKIQRDFC